MYKCNVQVSQLFVLSVLYQSRLEVIYQVDTQCSITRWKTKSWKYDAQPCIFDEIQCISSGDEMSNARYYFSNKMILEDAKVSSFSSDFQTLIKIILIPCTNWVRSLFRRLWIEFFPLFYGAYNSHMAINQQENQGSRFFCCAWERGAIYSNMIHRIGIWKCRFLRRGETRVPSEKPLGVKGKNQQQTQPTYGIHAGIWTWATLVGGN